MYVYLYVYVCAYYIYNMPPDTNMFIYTYLCVFARAHFLVSSCTLYSKSAAFSKHVCVCPDTSSEFIISGDNRSPRTSNPSNCCLIAGNNRYNRYVYSDIITHIIVYIQNAHYIYTVSLSGPSELIP